MYERLLKKSPIVVNALTGFIVASIGDVVVQQVIEEKSRVDYKRTCEMGLIRAAVITPFVAVWYPALVAASPGTQWRHVLPRIMIDQIVGSPIVISLVFLSSAILKGDSMQSAQSRFNSQLLPTWKRGLQYWPIVHLITFGIVPLAHQPLWAHFASVYWMGCLSYSTHTSLEVEKNDYEGKT